MSPLPFYFLLLLVVASLFIHLETALLPFTEIPRPQSYSSGALLRSNTFAPRHFPNTTTNSLEVLLKFDARQQPRDSTTVAVPLRQPAVTRNLDDSKTQSHLKTVAVRRPLTQKTGGSGAVLQSAMTRSATILQFGAAPNATKHVPDYFFGPQPSNAAPITQVNGAGVLLQSNTSAIQEPTTTASRSNATLPQPPEAAAATKKLLRGVVPNETKHDPRYFSEQVTIDNMMKRMNILTPYTGCSVAAFQYNLLQNPHPEFNDCFCHRGKKIGRSRGFRLDNTERLVKDGVTVYVQFNKLEHFVGMALPNIQHEFVLISGQEQKVQRFSKGAFDAIIDNPKVIHWFMMNVDVYSYDPRHPKISPWPYGSNPKVLKEFKEELLRKAPKRDNHIYLSGLSRTTNPQRLEIPRGPRVGVEKYLGSIHASRYVLSPDGDRPECYRHYEAIGMGAMPITQLDASTHSHLEGNAIFNNSVWNLTVLEATLPQNPQINQRLIFEEYWMEYVERTVGRPLRWWDPSRDAFSSLAEITDTVKKSAHEGIAGSLEETTSR